jgi:sarcosine oxidase/L-pipecolate oxidase
MARGLKKELPARLADKWRFRTEYQDDKDVFLGDGSRGGPEKARL